MSNLQSMNTDKTLQQVLSEVANSIKVSLHCVKIGEIVEFNKEKQTARVKVLHIQDENYNTRLEKELEYPLLGDVPVVIMGGGGTYISHPISQGDQCLLLFCDYMIDGWWVTGEAKPSFVPRKHDLSDAIAIVGLNATPNAIQNYSDYLRLQYNENSSIVIGNTIKLDNPIVETTGNIDAKGIVTATSVKPADGYSGVVYTGTQVLTFANGILVSIQP